MLKESYFTNSNSTKEQFKANEQKAIKILQDNQKAIKNEDFKILYALSVNATVSNKTLVYCVYKGRYCIVTFEFAQDHNGNEQTYYKNDYYKDLEELEASYHFNYNHRQQFL